jgi:transglutaminase-like putative cysteine protease/uncharacterized membrane protein YgcG
MGGASDRLNRKVEYPYLYWGSWILLCTAVAALESEFDGPVFVIKTAFWWLVFGLGTICGHHYRKTGNRAMPVMTGIAIVFGAVTAIGMPRLEIVDRLLLMLLWTQAGVNCILAKRRDFYLSYIVSLILVFAGAGFSRYAAYIGYMAAYVLALMFILIADYADDKLSEARGGDKDLLAGGLRLPLKGLEIALLAIAVSTVIYLLVPHFPSPELFRVDMRNRGASREDKAWLGDAFRDMRMQDYEARRKKNRGQKGGGAQGGENGGGGQPGGEGRGGGKGGGGYAGFGDSFGVGSGPVGLMPDKVMFFLKSDRALYCRGKIFNHFDGNNWTERDIEKQNLFTNMGIFIIGDTYYSEGVRQKYMIVEDMPPLIFSAYRPNALVYPAASVVLDSEFGLHSIGRVQEKGTIYHLKSRQFDFDGRPTAGRERCENIAKYLQMPGGTFSIRRLAHKIVENKKSDYEKAAAIENYLRENCRYMPSGALHQWGDEPVYEFLFKVRQGHSEIFATSMVMLLRSEDIPARFVTGYRATRFSPFRGVFEVRGTDVHSWVEAYINGEQWVTFEPTPEFKPPKKKIGSVYFFNFFDYADDFLKRMIATDPGAWWAKLLEMFREFIRRASELLKSAAQFLEGIAGASWLWLRGNGWWELLLAALALFLAPKAYRALLPFFFKYRLERLDRSDPKEFIIRCYLEMENFLKRRGLRRPVSMDVKEYRDFLGGSFPSLAGPAAAVADAFQRARYSDTPVSGADADDSLKAYWQILEAAPLSARKTTLTKKIAQKLRSTF